MTAKHLNSVPPQIVYPPGPIERQANTVPRGMLFGGGGLYLFISTTSIAPQPTIGVVVFNHVPTLSQPKTPKNSTPPLAGAYTIWRGYVILGGGFSLFFGLWVGLRPNPTHKTPPPLLGMHVYGYVGLWVGE